MTEMAVPMPSTSTTVPGNRFQGPERRQANALSSSTHTDQQKLPLQALLEKAQQYAQLVNGSARFRQSPGYIKGELRDYQVQALNWLISLYENKIGGILADEMGLGKTIQSISILGYLKFFKNINGPFLVIGTTSVIPSWMEEFKKFCPAMKVIKLTGDYHTRKPLITQMRAEGFKWDVCVTAVETILHEPFFRRQQWHYVVIDEAHRLKNENTVFGKLVRQMPSKNRLLLTGTPLQNNLHELWALLNYLMPDIFSDSNTFHARDEESMKSMKSILQPFFLRRIKADVEASLLPKIEINLFVGLTKLQRDTYIKTIDKHRLQTDSHTLQNLRKIANHPYLIRDVEPGPPYQDHGDHLINTSGKMMVLDKLLKDLKSNGSRVLLFSQFVDMLDIIEDYLDWRGYQYRRLDGTSHANRANDIDAFNAENSRIFIYILSTQAGSLGINLQTADTVIIFDSDWNPLTDLQAIDRAHRIGQQKQVRVYRLISENTVDECIVQRADVKLRLNNMMIDQGSVCENSQLEFGIKKKVLGLGIAAIAASDKAGITGVNFGTLLRYSQQKTIEKAEKLKNMKEIELRSIGLEEESVVLNPHQLYALYVNQSHNRVRIINNTKTVPVASTSGLVAPALMERITNHVNQHQSQQQMSPVRNSTVGALKRPSASSVNSMQAVVSIPKMVVPTPTISRRPAVASIPEMVVPTPSVNSTPAVASIPEMVVPTPSVNSTPAVASIPEMVVPTPPVSSRPAVASIREMVVPTPSVNSTPAVASIREIVVATPMQANSRLVLLKVYQFYPGRLIEMCDNRRMLDLSTDTSSKETLLAQGFRDWTEVDYNTFCDAVLKHGRFDLTGVAGMMPSKKMDEVVKYHEVFFRRGPSESAEINDILKKIKLEEIKHKQRFDAVKWKMRLLGRLEFQSVDNGTRNERFTTDHDRYLVCAMSRYGLVFNVCDRIIADIRFHADFGLFSTLRFGTISDQEIKDRINQLVTSIEDEYLDALMEIKIENGPDHSGDNNAKKRKLC